MPWFICDNCGESLKKAKVASHASQCGSHGFTCLDCSRAFDRWTVAGHTSCVTEHEKYAQGATKPGGYASQGCFAAQATQQSAPVAEGLVGPQFLSERAPWKCSACSVTCTSRESLEGHASGAKHQRRARAAMAAATGPTAKDGEPREAPGVAVADSKAASAAEAGKPSLVTTGKRPRESQSLALTEASSKVKWKKLATSELTRKGGSMKLKMLTAAVLASAGRGEESAAELLQKLESSGRFSLREKHIALVDV